MNLVKRIFSTFLTIGLLGCNNGDNGLVGNLSIEPSEPPPTEEVVTDLVITPKDSTIPAGSTQAFSVKEVLNNGQTRDITNSEELVWTSSDEVIATVSNGGIVTGNTVGIATIRVSKQIGDETLSDSAQLTVTDAMPPPVEDVVTDLVITPKEIAIPAGSTQVFSVEEVLSNGQTRDVTNSEELIWASSDEAIATVSQSGVVTGNTIGTVAINVSKQIDGETLSDNAQLTVTEAIQPPPAEDAVIDLVITPKDSAIPAGLTQAFSVEEVLNNGQVRDINNSEELIWTSSDETIATVSESGIVTGNTVGIATISVSKQIGDETLSDSAQLTVTEAIVTSLDVSPPLQTIPAGFQVDFTAMANLSDGRVINMTEQPSLSWSSSDDDIAVISNTGSATGKSIGSVTITALGEVNGQTVTQTATMTVTQAVVTDLEIQGTSFSTPLGIDINLRAIATLSNGQVIDVTEHPSLNWNTSDSTIAIISDKGIATGQSVGTVTITASGENNGTTFTSTASLSILEAIMTGLSVASTSESIPAGFVTDFIATASFSDGRVVDVTNQENLSWTSSDKNIATVSNIDNGKGATTGLQVGEVNITASIEKNDQTFTDSATLTVTEAIVTSVEVSPVTAESPVGIATSFVATAILSDGRTADITNQPSVTWQSSNSTIASISNKDGEKGVALGLNEGTVSISATDNSGNEPLTDSAVFKVSEAVITELTISAKTTASTPVGLTIEFEAIATLSDGTTVDVTHEPSITWQSSDSTIASISNRNGEKGVVTGRAIGEVNITASIESNGQTHSDSAQLSVTEVIVTALEVNAVDETFAAGLTTLVFAIATMSDGSIANVTYEPNLSWQSDDNAIASTTGDNLIKGVSQGDVKITASGEFNGQLFVASTNITVTEAVPVSIAVSPQPQQTLDTPQIPTGWRKAFFAHATLTNGSVVDVSNDEHLVWRSSDEGVATISNTLETKGQASGVSVGTSTIEATLSFGENAMSDSATLTITPPHSATFYVDTKIFSNVVAGMPIQYIGYSIHAGNHLVLSGSEYLDNSMSSIYLGGEVGKPIDDYKFYFSQSGENQISGALKYQAFFTWPDSSVTQGVLEWDFISKNYKLTTTEPVELLLANGWYFTLEVSNEVEF